MNAAGNHILLIFGLCPNIRKPGGTLGQATNCHQKAADKPLQGTREALRRPRQEPPAGLASRRLCSRLLLESSWGWLHVDTHHAPQRRGVREI